MLARHLLLRKALRAYPRRVFELAYATLAAVAVVRRRSRLRITPMPFISFFLPHHYRLLTFLHSWNDKVNYHRKDKAT